MVPNMDVDGSMYKSTGAVKDRRTFEKDGGVQDTGEANTYTSNDKD